jgi:hypothetical protein
MFDDASKPAAHVLWLNHDIIAKHLSLSHKKNDSLKIE